MLVWFVLIYGLLLLPGESNSRSVDTCQDSQADSRTQYFLEEDKKTFPKNEVKDAFKQLDGVKRRDMNKLEITLKKEIKELDNAEANEYPLCLSAPLCPSQREVINERQLTHVPEGAGDCWIVEPTISRPCTLECPEVELCPVDAEEIPENEIEFGLACREEFEPRYLYVYCTETTPAIQKMFIPVPFKCSTVRYECPTISKG